MNPEGMEVEGKPAPVLGPLQRLGELRKGTAAFGVALHAEWGTRIDLACARA